MPRTLRANLPMRLDGSRNTRDLGGYPTIFGTNTAGGQFLRSDQPSKLTDGDLQSLYDYGVRLVIDFRTKGEAQKEPGKLMGYRNVKYVNPPMIDDLYLHDSIKPFPKNLGDMYIDFLDNKKGAFLTAFRDILRHMDDCVFFNCMAGKDRTGTFAMTLLKLAGVSDQAIVIDYQVTGKNVWPDMKPLLDYYNSRGFERDEDMFRSRAIHMERALAHLQKTYGTIEHWMTLCGLTEREINALRNKMLGIQ